MTFLGVSPYLYYDDADAALDWLERVFGFGPSKRDHGDSGGPTEEAEIAVGPGAVHVCGRGPDAGERRELLIVRVDDVAALHERVAAAVDHEVKPPRDTGYGPLAFDIDDPWGYHWYFWQGEAKYRP